MAPVARKLPSLSLHPIALSHTPTEIITIERTRVFLPPSLIHSPPLSAESLFVERRAAQIGRDKRVHFPRSITGVQPVNYSGNYLLLRESRGRKKEKKGKRERRGDNEGKIYDPVRGEGGGVGPQLCNYR